MSGVLATAVIGLMLGGCATVGPQSSESTKSVSTAAEVPTPAKPETAAVAPAPAAEEAKPVVIATPVPYEPTAPRYKTEDILWDRIRAGFTMPELDSDLVAAHERFYLSRPDYLKRVFERGGKYLFHIVEELDRRGMPAEIALLPIVESAFNPKALSSAKAAGLWQFIPSTGKQYNLHQNWWSDHRRDVIDSTHAALDYLQRIYELNNRDWFLALASYNWGEGNVMKAVKRSHARGGSGDYLSIDMPQETRHYVPKLIALRNILRRMDNTQLGLPVVHNKPYFVAIEKSRSIDLKLAAQFAGMSVDEFVALNPAHNRPVISASRHNRIIVPADRADEFSRRVEQHANKTLATWKPYTLKQGESLEVVADKAGLSVTELKKANGLTPVGKVIGGTTILAPLAEPQDEKSDKAEKALADFVAPRVVEQVDVRPAYHTVGKKENLATIADRYDISVALLKAWNGVKASAKRGMTLMVRPASTQTVVTNESGVRQVVASSRHEPANKFFEDAPKDAAKDEGAKLALASSARKESSESAADNHGVRAVKVGLSSRQADASDDRDDAKGKRGHHEPAKHTAKGKHGKDAKASASRAAPAKKAAVAGKAASSKPVSAKSAKEAPKKHLRADARSSKAG